MSEDVKVIVSAQVLRSYLLSSHSFRAMCHKCGETIEIEEYQDYCDELHKMQWDGLRLIVDGVSCYCLRYEDCSKFIRESEQLKIEFPDVRFTRLRQHFNDDLSERVQGQFELVGTRSRDFRKARS